MHTWTQPRAGPGSRLLSLEGRPFLVGRGLSRKLLAQLRMTRGDSKLLFPSLINPFWKLNSPHPGNRGPDTTRSCQSSSHTGNIKAHLATEKQQRSLGGAQPGWGSSLNTVLSKYQGQMEKQAALPRDSSTDRQHPNPSSKSSTGCIRKDPGVASPKMPVPSARGMGGCAEREDGVSTLSKV